MQDESVWRKGNRPLLLIALAVLASSSLLLGACGDGKDSQVANINVADFKFQPAEIAIEVGDSVTWENFDSSHHTATAEEGSPFSFDTGTLDRSRQRSVRFTKPGTFRYLCSFHPFMEGKVIVNK